MKLDWSHWFYSLGKSVIGGMAAAGAAWCGTAIGHAIAPGEVAVMNWSSLGFVVLTSSITNLFFFLKQSPLPEDLEDKK